MSTKTTRVRFVIYWKSRNGRGLGEATSDNFTSLASARRHHAKNCTDFGSPRTRYSIVRVTEMVVPEPRQRTKR